MPQDFSSEALVHATDDYSISSNDQGNYYLTLTISPNNRLETPILNPILNNPGTTIVNIVTQVDTNFPNTQIPTIPLGSGQVLNIGDTKNFQLNFFEFPAGESIILSEVENYQAQHSGESMAKKKVRNLTYTRTQEKRPDKFNFFEAIMRLSRKLFGIKAPQRKS